MMRRLLTAILILVTALHSYAAVDNYAAQWSKGNNYYQQKQYDSAATSFEQIAALKPRNAAVYYNLGNTYYRLNKIALAVLNYERALAINPDYAEARDNLLIAQSHISNHIQHENDIFFVNWWHSATKSTAATTWAVVALLVFLLMLILLFVKRLGKSGLKLPGQIPVILGVVCIFFLFLAFSAAKNTEEKNVAVVMQSDAPLMGAELKGKPLILVPEGTTVKIRSEKGNWVEVSLPDGRTGWLQQELIDKI